MPNPVQRNISFYFLSCIIAIAVLLLTAANLNQYFTNQKVLGIKTQLEEETKEIEKDKEFWKIFLADNPSYIPGWIELGEFEKVKLIDPNYFLQP
jgi:hypothetical protein